LAFGGIILSDCNNGKIQENRIEENGKVSGAPVCGIFVLYGEKMDISTNSIINNGLPVTDAKTVVKAANRGGIVVKMSFKTADLNKLLSATKPSFDGVPAVVVHDNVVSQPHGFALLLFAFGPVSVVSNQFTSFGTDKSNILSLLASSVFILNLGISKDIFIIAFQNMGRTNGTYGDNTQSQTATQAALRAVQFLPNGKVMFAANQTTLDMRSPLMNFCLSSQLIASLDDVAFNTNQSECASLLSVLESGATTADFALINTVLFGVSVRANDNRFTDGLTFTIYSLVSFGVMNTAIGNQSTHCLLTLGSPAKMAVNSNVVLINTLCKDKK
jgi:uncharacterized membrane protein